MRTTPFEDPFEVLNIDAVKMPELYCFIHVSLSGSPKLSYNTYIIESVEESQQGTL